MDKETNKRILDLIYNSIISEGGDGDALWLSKHTPLPELKLLVEEYNQEHSTGWNVKEEDNVLLWEHGEEWAVITDKKEVFDSQPRWIVLKIDY